MELSLDLVLMVLTLGCIVFTLQTLIDYNKQASVIRPKLREVARIKDSHEGEIEKVKRTMDESDKDCEKFDVELAELEAKHAELEIVATDLRSKVDDEEE